jgi:hypothetical protein
MLKTVSQEFDKSTGQERQSGVEQNYQISPIVGDIIASASAKAYFGHTGKALEDQMRAMVRELYSDQDDPSLPLAAAADLYARGFTYRIKSNNQIALYDPALSVNSGPIYSNTPDAIEQMLVSGREVLEDQTNSEGFAAWYRGLEDIALTQVDTANQL